MSQKITIPIPPYFTGSDSSFLPISLQKFTISKNRNKFFIYSLIQLGKVLIVYVTLCLKPPTNAQYAACGSIAAILIKTSSWLIHSKTLNSSVPNVPPRYLYPSLVILILVSENILVARCDAYGLTTSHVFVSSN